MNGEYQLTGWTLSSEDRKAIVFKAAETLRVCEETTDGCKVLRSLYRDFFPAASAEDCEITIEWILTEIQAFEKETALAQSAEREGCAASRAYVRDALRDILESRPLSEQCASLKALLWCMQEAAPLLLSARTQEAARQQLETAISLFSAEQLSSGGVSETERDCLLSHAADVACSSFSDRYIRQVLADMETDSDPASLFGAVTHNTELMKAVTALIIYAVAITRDRSRMSGLEMIQAEINPNLAVALSCEYLREWELCEAFREYAISRKRLEQKLGALCKATVIALTGAIILGGFALVYGAGNSVAAIAVIAACVILVAVGIPRLYGYLADMTEGTADILSRVRMDLTLTGRDIEREVEKRFANRKPLSTLLSELGNGNAPSDLNRRRDDNARLLYDELEEEQARVEMERA